MSVCFRGSSTYRITLYSFYIIYSIVLGLETLFLDGWCGYLYKATSYVFLLMSFHILYLNFSSNIF